MNKPLLFIFVPLIVIAYLFDGISVASFGLSLFLLLGCMIYATLAGLNRQSERARSFLKAKGVRNVFFAYLLFIVCSVVAHFANGSTTTADYQYLASLAGQALWFPVCWYMVQRAGQAFEKVLKVAVVSMFTVIMLFWMLGVVQNVDPFFLRNAASPFGGIPIAPHFFENPNRAARSLMILLVFATYFFYISPKLSSKYWKVMVFILCGLVLSTLSRSGIAGMLLLMVTAFLSQQAVSKKIFYSGVLGALVFSIVIFIPGANDRIQQAVSTIVSLNTGIETSELDNTVSIRARSWRASYQIIGDNPVFGVGASNALFEMGNYGALAWKGGDGVQAIWVHGGFLKIGLYAGLLGIIPFFLFLYTLGKALFTNYLSFRFDESRQKYAAIAGLSGLFASIPVNIGADFYTIGFVWFMFAYLLACSSLRR